jgi:hypothetical protein
MHQLQIFCGKLMRKDAENSYIPKLRSLIAGAAETFFVDFLDHDPKKLIEIINTN